jgi:AAA ATPase-like protein
VAIGAHHAHVGDLVGVRHLAELLTHPGREIPATVLASRIADPSERRRDQQVVHDAVGAADAARVRELAADLAEAEAHHDIARGERIQVELDALVERLEAATGIGRPLRADGPSDERARTAVRKAVKRALDAIEAADPAVGRTLRRTIRTGAICVYTPEAHHPVTWTAGHADTGAAGPAGVATPGTAPADGAPSASTGPASAGTTIGDRLRQESRRYFVGRAAEIGLVQDALAAPDPAFSVLYVHGPGGIGKSALLDRLAADAAAAGKLVVHVDLHTIPARAPAFVAALAGAVDRTGSDDLAELVRDLRQLVLVVDTFELGDALQDWLADELIPALPAGTLVMIAGRNLPPTRWQTDPAWRTVARVVALGNLTDADVGRYLDLHGLDAGLHRRVLALTRGHPLALSLVVDVLHQRSSSRRDIADLMDTPDVVRTLVQSFVGEIPDPQRREALAACAHVRFTTEDLLRSAVDVADAGDLFEWLRSRPFVAESRHGLFPHDLAREVLDTDLRWRDRVGYQDLHTRIRAYLLRRLQAPRESERQRAAVDLISLHRMNPVIRPLFDWASLGDLRLERMRPDDAAVVVEMTDRHQGAEQAELARHWIDRQPDGFVVFRRKGEVVGYVAILRLHDASPDDIARDPGAGAMWAYATTHEPPGPGEPVTAARFAVDRAQDQRRPSASSDGWSMIHLLRTANTPGLTWDFIGPWQSPDVDPLMRYVEYHRVPAADFEVGGRHHFVYAHDWRRLGWEGFVEVMSTRELGQFLAG